MKRRLVLLVLLVFVSGAMVGQDVTPTATPVRRRGWLSRILHPFSPNVVPQYKDPHLRGLALDFLVRLIGTGALDLEGVPVDRVTSSFSVALGGASTATDIRIGSFRGRTPGLIRIA